MAESTRELADARRRGAVAEAAAPRRSFDIARSKLMDGVAYLHDIFFEAIYKRMSYDGGEYLRYSLFPEVAKEMSKKSRRMVESTCAGACSPTCRRTCLSTAASTSVTRGPSSRRAPAAWCRARRSTSRARPRTSWSARGLTASGGQPQTALASRLCPVRGRVVRVQPTLCPLGCQVGADPPRPALREVVGPAAEARAMTGACWVSWHKL